METLQELRENIDVLNRSLVDLLSRRASIADRIAGYKVTHGLPTHAPQRELEMLRELVGDNPGPLSDDHLAYLLKEIFKTSRAHMDRSDKQTLRVLRSAGQPDSVFELGGARLGEEPVLIAGPCSIESETQIHQTARFLASRGVKWLRGGAFKPRSSPYDFQGLGAPALVWMQEAAAAAGMNTVTEVVDPRHVDLVAERIDVLQIGARNMQNFELLKEVGRTNKIILLKRGLSARIEELLQAAEYIAMQGNARIILCERGIRTFEPLVRNTLDVAAISLLRQMSALPVIADVSHAAGRKDILAPLARAALGAGAQGILLEVHPLPATALSDAQQQLDFAELDRFLAEVPLFSSAHVQAVSA